MGAWKAWGRAVDGLCRWFCATDAGSLISLPSPLQMPWPLYSRWSVGIVRTWSRLQLSGPAPSVGWILVVWGQSGRQGRVPQIRETQTSNWEDSPSTHIPRASCLLDPWEQRLGRSGWGMQLTPFWTLGPLAASYDFGQGTSEAQCPHSEMGPIPTSKGYSEDSWRWPPRCQGSAWNLASTQKAAGAVHPREPWIGVTLAPVCRPQLGAREERACIKFQLLTHKLSSYGKLLNLPESQCFYNKVGIMKCASYLRCE